MLQSIGSASISVVLALVMFSGVSSVAQAQPGVNQPGPEAIIDSTGTPDIFDRMRIHPYFRSQFRVNKNTTNFDNSIAGDYIYGPMKLSANLNAGIQKNEARNDRRATSGRNLNSAEYITPRYGGFTFGTDFGFNRQSSTDLFNRTVANTNRIDLVLTTGALGFLLQDRFDIRPDLLNWEFTSKLGLKDDIKINQRFDRNSGLQTKSDSTSTDGVTSAFDTKLIVTPWTSFSFDLGMSLDRTVDDSRTELFDERALEIFQLIEDTNESAGNMFTASMNYNVGQGGLVNLTGRKGESAFEEYSTTVNGIDTKYGDETALRLSMKGSPFWGLNWTFEPSYLSIDTSYDISDKGAGTNTYDLRGDVLFSLGEMFGMFQRLDVLLEGEFAHTKRSYDNSANYDEDRKYLKLRFERAFGPRFSGLIVGSANLVQTYYDPLAAETAADRLDRDKLHRDFETKWTYRFKNPVTTSVSFNWKGQESINVASRKSLGNTNQDELNVYADYRWEMTPGISLRQKYNVAAASQTYSFDDGRSNLNRTSTLTTEFDSLIGWRTNIRFWHEFRFGDSGNFQVDEDTGIRTFLKTDDQISNRLHVEASFRVQERFILFFKQKYDVRENERIATESVSVREDLEINWGWDFTYDLSWDLGLQTRFERIDTTREPSYWKGQAAVNKTF